MYNPVLEYNFAYPNFDANGITEYIYGYEQGGVRGNGTRKSITLIHQSGASFLDYTDPEAPVILVDGIYAMFAGVQMSTLMAILYRSVMSVKLSLGDIIISGISPLLGVGIGSPIVNLSLAPIPLLAGDILNVSVAQGSHTRLSFIMGEGYLTKLS